MNRTWQLLLAVLILVTLVVLGRSVPIVEHVEAFVAWVRQAGVVGVLAYAVAYIGVTLVAGPAGLMSASAGLIWGLPGLVVVIGSATLAAVIALGLGRTLARQRVQSLLDRDARSAAIARAVSDGGWRIVGLLRMSPILPFGIQNYLLAMTEIRLLPYILATAIAIVPSSAVYVYVGSLGRTVGQAGETPGPLRWAIIAVGLVATVLVIREVSRRARVALSAAADGIEPD